MGRNSINLIKLTSITFLFQFLNSFSFYLPIFILFLIKLNGLDSIDIKPSKVELNNEFLTNTYYKDLVTQDQAQLRFNKTPSITYLDLQLALSKQNVRYSKSIEISGFRGLFKQDSNSSELGNKPNLIELFFPFETFGSRSQVETLIQNKQLDTKKFGLECLNMSSNDLNEGFFDGYSLASSRPSLAYSALFNLILNEFFTNLRFLELSSNKFQHLERKHLEIFTGIQHNKPSGLETILFDNNELTSIRHDTFYDFKNLKYLSLSNNKLKLIHPLTFSFQASSSLNLINLRNNQLKALFNTPNLNSTSSKPLENLKFLYLNGNVELKCDCGLLWLYRIKNSLNLAEFECNKNENFEFLNFDSIESENFLIEKCSKIPNLVVNTKKFEKSSEFSLFRSLTIRWFAWNIFPDQVRTTTPYPYLMSDKFTDNEHELEDKLRTQEKHVFHTWLTDDAVFECSNKNDSSDVDDSKSTIVWKTQYGYLSYLDQELMDGQSELNNNDTSYYNSFKIFYKMNKLTQIHKSFTIRIGNRFGGETRSNFYVNNKNQLIVTNMRQIVAGPFVCISINERGVNSYEYDIQVRTGVSEYFIYSLFVSLISMIVPSIIGIIVCCICEYQADRDYPMTPPCYPTPLASTPPNFDFNEWMANAASYFPNLNIHETLEQVSKRLRKGMEKASVTVKSLGVTSSAYIYSMYEQSSQRWYDLKQYVPSLNVPTLNLPTMRYPPMGQLANRMRMGMGNMFIQVREFCGTSDMIHTASIVDLEADCKASNAVGKTYIMDQFNLKQTPNSRFNQHNFYRFLHLIKEESKLSGKFDRSLTAQTEFTEEYEIENENEAEKCKNESSTDDIKPSTSGLNAASSKNCDYIFPQLHLGYGGASGSDDSDDDLAYYEAKKIDKKNLSKIEEDEYKVGECAGLQVGSVDANNSEESKL